MNRGPIDRPRSVWFAAIVALFVGLGAQVLLESLVPADFADWSFSAVTDAATIHRAASDSLWIGGTIIRFISFAIAGLVAVLFLGALPGRLLGALLVVAVLSTVFEQFPSRPNLVLAAFWCFAAPIAVVSGAWIASARRSGDTSAHE
jgi:hypothetical protein